MARLPSIGGDNGSWGTVLNEFLSVGMNSDGTLKNVLGTFNVKEYGAKGDGTTNDISAINAAIVAAESGIIYFPPGIYAIDSAIDIPENAHGLQFVGSGANATFIRQNTSNTPIIRSARHLIHNIGIHNLHLTYNTQQTTGNTDSYGVQWAADPDHAGEQHNNYLWSITNVTVSKAYIGMGCRALDTGQSVSIWGSYWESITIQDYAHIGMNIASPLSVGMPNNVMNRLYFLGQNTKANSYALYGKAVELRITGFEVNEQNNRVLYFEGGHPVTITGCHIETLMINEASSRIVEVANGNLTINDFALSNVTVNASTARVFLVSTGGSLMVNGMEAGATIQSGSIQLMFAGGSDRDGVWIRGLGSYTNMTPGTMTNVRLMERLGAPIQTFTASDTTPSVFGFYQFKTNNASATSITTFDDGYPGQQITIIFTDTNTTISEANNIKLASSFTSTADDTMSLIFDGINWYEISRSVN